VRKKLIALLSIFVLLLAPSLIQANAAGIPDEQLTVPRPPAEGVGGYSGAYYDDQSTLNRAFSYVEAWSSSNFATATYTTCRSAEEETCKSSNYVGFETPLSPCTDLRTRDCVDSFSANLATGNQVKGNLVELTESSFINLSSALKLRYNTVFKGDQKRGIPDSGKVSLWKFPGLTHAGGDEFLLIPKLNVQMQDVAGSKPSNLDVGVFAISRTSSSGKQASDCFFLTSSTCFIRWALPSDATFSISIKTGSRIIGWFHGRINSPEISSQKLADGQTQVNISGTPMLVPIVAAWSKNTDLPPALDAMLEKEFIERNYVLAGSGFFGGEEKDRSKMAVINDINSPFDDSTFERYLLWVKVANDKAYANVSTWSFRTMDDYRSKQEFDRYGKCIGDSEVAGMVTTNSNAYIAGPPKFQDNGLSYRVASPHFDSKGSLQVGTYDLAIRSDVARCIYGFTDAPIQASLSVVYSDGEAKTATTLVSEKNNWFKLAAKGFTYSAPTLKIKLSQEAPIPTPSAKPSAEPTPIAAQVLPPVMINPLKAKTISVKIGKVVVFTVADPAIWKGKVADSKIAKFVAGGPKSTYETNPSLTLLKKGKTTVSLTDGKKTYLLKLTVS
jgi:hypothetical protein